jgi:hydroxylaminobenzene mutase
MNTELKAALGHKLIWFGVLLLLLGLLTGFAIPVMTNPRMGLSSHLEGTLNGMLLILFGLIWTKLNASDKLLKFTFALALFGTFTNWVTTLFAAVVGAGSEMMPLAGENLQGSLLEEVIIKFGLISLSLAIVTVCVVLLLGLRKNTSSN